MKDIWKKFDETELTHSSVHHLMAIYHLLKENGYARSIDVARYLNLTRGSVSITLHKLKKKNYVVEDENKFLNLTEKGKGIINSVLSTRRVLINFFREVLKLPEDTAEEDACKIEHLISQETGEKLMAFVGYTLSDAIQTKIFRNEFDKFSLSCQSRAECDICELDCFFNEKESAATE